MGFLVSLVRKGAKAMKSEKKKTGVQMPIWAHPLVVKVAALTDSEIGAAYTDAIMDWLKRSSKTNEIVKMFLESEAKKNPELRAALEGNAPAINPIRKRA